MEILLTKLLLVASIFQTFAKGEQAVIGKIVAVDNPNVKRSQQNKEKNQIFATRAISFLKKDGDSFIVHRPGLLGGNNSVSFESVRLPGFFFRQKNMKLHLDNLKSRFIKKDATFLVSKDVIGETYRLFMHEDRFLCHESVHGLNLIIQKDTPKRDTLNCAFNIVPVKKSPLKQKGENSLVKINQTKQGLPKKIQKPQQGSVKAHPPVSSYIKDKTSGKMIPEFKDLVDAIKQNKDPFPNQQQQHGGSIVVLSSGSPEGGNGTKILPVAVKKPKPKNGKEAAQLKKKVPKPAVAPKPTVASKPAVAPKKILQQNKKPKPFLKPNTPAAGNASKLKNAGKLMQPKKGFLGNAARQYAGRFAFRPAFGSAQRNVMIPKMTQGANTAFFKTPGNRLFLGSPTKKLTISNPNFMNLQAYPNQQQQQQQQQQQRQFLNGRNQYYPKMYSYYSTNYPQPFRQANAISKQLVTHIYPETVSHYTNVLLPGQDYQYVPPSQWDQILSNHKPLLNPRPAIAHQDMHVPLADHHPIIASNSYETDKLLDKLHPELSLVHNANHDVNEVATSDPNIHHLDSVHHTQSVQSSHSSPMHVTSLPHETASHSDFASVVHEPLNVVQHVNLPSHDDFTNNFNDHVSTVNHISQPVAMTTHPGVLESSFEAEHSLVHTNPDITLKEAFDRMTPLHTNLVEVSSEPLQTDKAFHMRTHYVSGKPIDMDEENPNSLREVHVVHHNHHIVHTSNEGEKEKFISTLVDATNDLCISLMFVNQLGDRYRIVSTINPHGYRPKGIRFSLKTVFKEAKKRKVMSFKAYDDADVHRPVLLNGHKELNIYPTSCTNDPVKVIVDSFVSKVAVALGSKKHVIEEVKHGETAKRRHAENCQRVTGGTSKTGSCCVFPFIFKGKTYNNCIPFGDDRKKRWCSLSTNFNAERRWGMCSIPDTSGLQPEPPKETSSLCPKSCKSECGANCPMSCCSDASSSLFH